MEKSMEKSFYYLEHYVNPQDDSIWIRYYGRHGRWVERSSLSPYCFIEANGDDKVYRKCAQTDLPLTIYEYRLPSHFHSITQDHRTWEGDISYERRFMLDNELTIDDVPKCYVDIETDDSDGASNPETHEIISIAMLFDDGKQVFLSNREYTEMEMLDEFIRLMHNVGMIITWNGGEDVWETRSFDIPYMAKRYTTEFKFDQALKHVAYYDLMRGYKDHKVKIGEGLAGGYSLENVSQHELGKGKIKHKKRIGEMTQKELEEYNMMDVILLKEIDDKVSLTDLTISIAQTCFLRLTNWTRNKRRKELNPLSQLDQLFIKTCKEVGVAWTSTIYSKNKEYDKITGAVVLEPKIGIFHNVQNVDIMSMYPSIIINERYSPDKDRVLIPKLLNGLITKRREIKKLYKETKESKYNIWQYAYKVVANTAYGAMANVWFRGFDREIAQAVTVKGQSLLKEIKGITEDLGYEVLYGDTDSLFVHVDKDGAKPLLNMLNRRIEPYKLELGEFYKSMIFTGNEHGGIKKRYAGILEDGSLYIKGLESIRGEYSILARETQLLILNKLLNGATIDTCKKCLNNLKKQLFDGLYDDMLVMTKKVRDLDDYNKERTYPPHVRALEKAHKMGFEGLYEINYFWTLNDVEPYVNDLIPNNIDYDHYFTNQVLSVVSRLFESIVVQNGGGANQSKRRKKAMMESESLTGFT